MSNEDKDNLSMRSNMSDKIRTYAEHEYVVPARRQGRRAFTIAVRDVLDRLVEREGLPRQNVPQVCQALRSPRKFLNPLGLEIEKVEGPEKQTSTTVVFHYRFLGGPSGDRRIDAKHSEIANGAEEDSPIERLWGLMRKEFAELGGGEAFLKRLRTDPEKDRR
jgi:DNA-binding transcriptional MerR regulator